MDWNKKGGKVAGKRTIKQRKETEKKAENKRWTKKNKLIRRVARKKEYHDPNSRSVSFIYNAPAGFVGASSHKLLISTLP